MNGRGDGSRSRRLRPQKRTLPVDLIISAKCRKLTSQRPGERSVLLVDMSTPGRRQIYCEPQWPNSEIRASLHGVVHIGAAKSVLDLGGCCHEIAIPLCRALGCRYPVNRVAVRPRRDGRVANCRLLHLASQRHGRSSETSGDATTQAGTGGKHRCRSPDSAGHSNGYSDATACAGFGHGEACRDRENQQQLHRWLPIELQVRQPALERVLHNR
jgi:hypothetical protein